MNVKYNKTAQKSKRTSKRQGTFFKKILDLLVPKKNMPQPQRTFSQEIHKTENFFRRWSHQKHKNFLPKNQYPKTSHNTAKLKRNTSVLKTLLTIRKYQKLKRGFFSKMKLFRSEVAHFQKPGML